MVAWNVRTLQRRLSAILPEARPASGGAHLELTASSTEPARLAAAPLIEESVLQSHSLSGSPVTAFRAFLDGTQRSEVANYIGPVPVVLGHTAAVIRERIDRRMHTWSAPLTRKAIYVPRDMLQEVTWSTLSEELGAALVDTSRRAAEGGSHPFALRDAAFQRIQDDRELLERSLAEQWCTTQPDPLFIDGGISGSAAIATSRCAIGVVKTHRTLYAEGDALTRVLDLSVAERTSVFRVTSPKRTTVASWYLRLRDPDTRDPMWGLVRVEVSEPSGADVGLIGARADEVSRWILAEISPVALPDPRWDRMAYGIYDCEQFLRATAG